MAKLDWSNASVGDPQPCVLCGRPALMRSPEKGVPCHKVCAERWYATRSGETPLDRAAAAETAQAREVRRAESQEVQLRRRPGWQRRGSRRQRVVPVVGRTYLDVGDRLAGRRREPVVVLTRWAPNGRGPRNVAVRRRDGSVQVIPSGRLRQLEREEIER